MKESRYVYNIAFTVNGVKDETQFDSLFHNHQYEFVDLMNCFLEFIKENKFENVKVEYIEYWGEEKEE